MLSTHALRVARVVSPATRSCVVRHGAASLAGGVDCQALNGARRRGYAALEVAARSRAAGFAVADVAAAAASPSVVSAGIQMGHADLSDTVRGGHAGRMHFSSSTELSHGVMPVTRGAVHSAVDGDVADGDDTAAAMPEARPRGALARMLPGAAGIAASAKVAFAEGAAAAPMVSAPIAKALAVLPPACFGFLQLAPLKEMKVIKANKSVGNLPALPYVSLATNCIIWSSYGAFVQDMTVFAPNFTGMLCGLYYTYTYHKNTEQKPMKEYAAAGATLAACAGMALTLPPDVAGHYIGLTGCTVAVLLMASPLAALGTIIKSKSTESLPFLMSFAVFLNSSSWSAYGYLVAHNPLIWMPNVLGLAAATVQLSLFAIYPSKK